MFLNRRIAWGVVVITACSACSSDRTTQKQDAPPASTKSAIGTGAEKDGRKSTSALRESDIASPAFGVFDIVEMKETTLKLNITRGTPSILTTAANSTLTTRGLSRSGDHLWVSLARDSKANPGTRMRPRTSRLIKIVDDSVVIDFEHQSISKHYRDSIPPLSSLRGTAPGESKWVNMETGARIVFPEIVDLTDHQSVAYELIPVDGAPPVVLAQITTHFPGTAKESKSREVNFDDPMFLLSWADVVAGRPVALRTIRQMSLSMLVQLSPTTTLASGDALLGVGNVGIMNPRGRCISIRRSSTGEMRCVLHDGAGSRKWQLSSTGALIEVVADKRGMATELLGVRLSDGSVHSLPKCGRIAMDLGDKIGFGCGVGVVLWDGAREIRFPAEPKVDLQGRVASKGKRTLRHGLGERGPDGVAPFFLDTKRLRAAPLSKKVITISHIGRWAMTVLNADGDRFMVDGETMTTTKIDGLTCAPPERMEFVAASATHWVMTCQAGRPDARSSVFVVEHSTGATSEIDGATFAAVEATTLVVAMPAENGSTKYKDRRLARFNVEGGAPFYRD